MTKPRKHRHFDTRQLSLQFKGRCLQTCALYVYLPHYASSTLLCDARHGCAACEPTTPRFAGFVVVPIQDPFSVWRKGRHIAARKRLQQDLLVKQRAFLAKHVAGDGPSCNGTCNKKRRLEMVATLNWQRELGAGASGASHIGSYCIECTVQWWGCTIAQFVYLARTSTTAIVASLRTQGMIALGTISHAIKIQTSFMRKCFLAPLPSLSQFVKQLEQCSCIATYW